MNIALIGHMGSGKTIIGKLLAKKLNLEFFDSDYLIEKATNKSINQIFKEEGENRFRFLEEKVILELSNNKNTVLSLGGGSILSKKTRNFLKIKYLTIFLDIDFATLEDRLKNSKKRPLIKNINIKNKLLELDVIRRKYYMEASITIKDIKSAGKTSSLIIKKISEINDQNNN